METNWVLLKVQQMVPQTGQNWEMYWDYCLEMHLVKHLESHLGRHLDCCWVLHWERH